MPFALSLMVRDLVYSLTFTQVKRDSLDVNTREKTIFLLIEERGRQKEPGIIFLGV